MGIVGAEERDELIREGEYLYREIEKDHVGFARNKIVTVTGEAEIPWMEAESVCIALALYARRMVSDES